MKTAPRLTLITLAAMALFASVRPAFPDFFYDDFNDGQFDRNKWKHLAWSDRTFRESNGRLNFARLNRDPGLSVKSALACRFVRTENVNSKFDVRVLVRVPHKLNPGSGHFEDWFSLGLGLLFGESHYIKFQLRDERDFGRGFSVDWRSSTDGDFNRYPIPADAKAAVLLRVVASYKDKIKFYWKNPGDPVWRKAAPTLDASQTACFGLPYPSTIRPFIFGYDDAPNIRAKWNVYFDNFSASFN